MKDMTRTCIRIERTRLAELKRRALEQNRSLASLVREILDNYLKRTLPTRDRLKLAARQRRAIRKWSGTSLGR